MWESCHTRENKDNDPICRRGTERLITVHTFVEPSSRSLCHEKQLETTKDGYLSVSSKADVIAHNWGVPSAPLKL